MSLPDFGSPTVRRRGIATLVTGGLALAAVLAATPAHAVAPISSTITNDPHADKGTLTFFNSSGAVITSGSNLHQLFSYAEASAAGRVGATKATVDFAFPDHTKADSQQWTDDQVTASTTYPNSSAPAPVNAATNPVAEADSGDADLASLLPTTTQDQTDGFKQYLQVRLFDSGPGVSRTSDFWATDIFYDPVAGTWQQVFPAVAQTTTTSLAASPSGGTTPHSTITLTATLAPSAAAGTVQFKDGATDIGSPVAVSGGTATTTTSFPTTGSHSFTAVFTPTDAGAYQPSTSSPVNYVVGDATSLSIGKSTTINYGTSSTVAGTLTDTTASTPAAGQTVFIYHRTSPTAAWVKGPSAVSGSTGKVSFSEKPTGRTLYQLRFPGTSSLLSSTSGTETTTVAQLVSVNQSPATIAHGKSFALWGGVTPSASGRRITLQLKKGTSFSTVATTTTKKQKLPNGKTGVGYVFHQTQRLKGSYVFRVTVGATSSLLGATSRSVTERVT